MPLLLAPVAAGDEPPKGDLGELQGRWVFRKYEQNKANSALLFLFGILLDRKDVNEYELHVQGSGFTFHRGPELVLREAVARLDPEKNPKTIDLTTPRAGTKKTYPGIYKLEGDKWMLCIADGDARPTEFKANPGQLLLRYERPK
jgi:uncharacterized protein (TIGR03067 family)